MTGIFNQFSLVTPTTANKSVKEKMLSILHKNSDKSFVDRILNKEKYPTLDLGNGKFATHEMTWSEIDGKYYAYPTVLYDGKKLIKFTPDDALRRAWNSKNVIQFSSPEEADLFSKNYKEVWKK